MSRTIRWTTLCLLLLAGLATQIAVRRYLGAPGPLDRVELTLPLAQLPTQLEAWQGVDVHSENEDSLYGDEYLQREYYNAEENQRVALWVSYSRSGEDRGHHPEVCMAVAGKREDREARQTCQVDGPGDPVQQYRFTSPLEKPQWVFYWHYTLEPPQDGSLSLLQQLYQRLRRRPSSITIEVFAPEQSATAAESAQQFVLLVDRALRKHAGPTAIRSSNRLPVTVVAPDQVPLVN